VEEPQSYWKTGVAVQQESSGESEAKYQEKSQKGLQKLAFHYCQGVFTCNCNSSCFTHSHHTVILPRAAVCQALL